MCRTWFEHHLTGEILPRWLHKSPAVNGFFEARLDGRWERQSGSVATLVSQGRLLYNFAEGWRQTRQSAYLEAVAKGAAFLVRHMTDRQNGGWYWSVTADGRVADATKNTYGHAFALFGLAHAWDAARQPEVREAALQGWEAVSHHLRDRRGAFCSATSADFGVVQAGRSINPLMHLFEALLAAGDLLGEPQLHREAERLAAFALSLKDARRGLLPETFTDEWEPASASDGGRFEVGHQFEWAWLLSRAAELDVCRPWIAEAEHLVNGALEQGMDSQIGAIRSVLEPDGTARPGPLIYWVQCEALRALIHFATVRARSDLLTPAQHVYAFVRTRFLDPFYGGWFEAVDPADGPVAGPKGHLWKLDYHIVGLCVEAVRLLPPIAT
ncbi:MAG: AGE family epimerase/isomerase [Chthonomonadales bacterium]